MIDDRDCPNCRWSVSDECISCTPEDSNFEPKMKDCKDCDNHNIVEICTTCSVANDKFKLREKKMKVKIFKCSGKEYWYHDCIGMSFEVVKPSMSQGYRVVDDYDSCRIIESSDCELVPVQEGWLTEEQFDAIYDLIHNCNSAQDCRNRSCRECDKDKAKERGWIKQSQTARQELEEYVNTNWNAKDGLTLKLHYLINEAIREEAEKK